MPIGHSPHAPVNQWHPEVSGYCDRCNFKWLLKDLREQQQWAGQSIVGTGLLVCPTCMDKLQENGFRSIFIGPDPAPLQNPRPGNLPRQFDPPRQFVLDDPEADNLDDDGNYL